MPRFQSMEDLEDRIRHAASYEQYLQGQWNKQCDAWLQSIRPTSFVLAMMREGFLSPKARRGIFRATLPWMAGSLLRITLSSSQGTSIWRGLSFSMQRLLAEWMKYKSAKA